MVCCLNLLKDLKICKFANTSVLENGLILYLNKIVYLTNICECFISELMGWNLQNNWLQKEKVSNPITSIFADLKNLMKETKQF